MILKGIFLKVTYFGNAIIKVPFMQRNTSLLSNTVRAPTRHRNFHTPFSCSQPWDQDSIVKQTSSKLYWPRLLTELHNSFPDSFSQMFLYND